MSVIDLVERLKSRRGPPELRGVEVRLIWASPPAHVVKTFQDWVRNKIIAQFDGTDTGGAGGLLTLRDVLLKRG